MTPEAHVIKTPYDEEIARIHSINQYPWTLEAKREGWLEGHETGFEAGIEEVQENPELYGLMAPSTGSTI